MTNRFVYGSWLGFDKSASSKLNGLESLLISGQLSSFFNSCEKAFFAGVIDEVNARFEDKN